MKKMNIFSPSNMHPGQMSEGSTHQPDIKKEKKWTKGKKRKFKKLYLLLLLLVLLRVIYLVTSIVFYKHFDAEYHHDLALADTGIRELQTGISLIQLLSKNPLDAPTLTQAQHAFAASYTSFTQLDTDLKSLPGVSTSIPVYGIRLSAALHLVPLAVEMSQAGVVGCNALSLIVTRSHQPLSTGQGITMADLTTISNDLHQLEAIVNQAMGQVNALQSSDVQFDPRVGKAVASFHKYLPALRSSLDKINQLLPVLPALLGIGKPANYLVEVLDSTELRPGGGFVGNYGIASFDGGRLTAAHLTDTYLIDQAFMASGRSISYPSAYTWFDLAPGSWGLRDSNLDADFPTVAKNAEQNYKIEGGNTPLQGVIAITPFLIQHALAITGPIAVPEYHETVTAQNLIDRIHYYQVGPGRQGQDTPSPDGKSSVRKHFTALLADQFFTRIHKLPSSALPNLFKLLVSSLQTKDLQVYLNSPVAEQLLTLFHLDSSIQAPANDTLFVVDANISPDKASQFITNTLDDQVTIDEQGNTIHHTTITYDWKMNGEVYGSPLYRDYLRIYVPPGSILQAQQGWQPRGTGKAFGREVWAGFFTLSYSQIRTLSFTWKEMGVAKKDTAGWHYQYLIQRQAGSHWNFNVRVLLPSCTVKMHTSGGLTAKSKQVAVFNQSLTMDTDLRVDYSC
jgi:hypothetical protein